MNDARWRCSFCFEEFHLLMTVGRFDYCARCWELAGKPTPPPSGPLELAEAEVRIRQQMLRRGGPDQHRVRSGQS